MAIEVDVSMMNRRDLAQVFNGYIAGALQRSAEETLQFDRVPGHHDIGQQCQ